MPTGTDPQTIAQGVKIEPTKNSVVARAATKGQIVGSGNDSRVSGLASSTEVMSTSRLSTERPLTCAAWPPGSQSGSRPATTGIASKLQAGGGDDVAHSSVPAPHGFAPAGAPTRRLRQTLTTKSRTLTAIIAAPIDATRFIVPQPISAP